MNGNGRTGPIDEQLLAGAMLLAQHHIAFPLPALVVIAETAVAIVVPVRGAVLLPQQLPGGVLVPLQILVDVSKIGQRMWAGGLTALVGMAKQGVSSSASDISAGKGQLNPAAVNHSR